MKTHKYTRPIICRILWWNYIHNRSTLKHVENKFLEGNIELLKENTQVNWTSRYRKHKVLYDKWYHIEIKIGVHKLYEYLNILYIERKYPEHLEKKLEQALTLYKKRMKHGK